MVLIRRLPGTSPCILVSVRSYWLLRILLTPAADEDEMEEEEDEERLLQVYRSLMTLSPSVIALDTPRAAIADGDGDGANGDGDGDGDGNGDGFTTADGVDGVVTSPRYKGLQFRSVLSPPLEKMCRCSKGSSPDGRALPSTAIAEWGGEELAAAGEELAAAAAAAGVDGEEEEEALASVGRKQRIRPIARNSKSCYLRSAT